MTPAMGRIVHYTPFAGETRPAIIVTVENDENCRLVVFGEAGVVFVTAQHAPSDDTTPGCWHWPVRE